jgi:uroporphyrinogen III methyltransferase/synthase
MSPNKKGVVYLIGAGPGDPGLITVKGQHLLRNCDAVIYDNLVPAELIVSLPDNVEKRYVGKKAGHHSLPQDEINRLLVDLANQGKKVARLKGSDPLVFGRGGEEAAFLKENGIPYEIIPGVTAALGAAAHSGIPCTDRNKASCVLFVTGHKAEEKSVSSVPWEWVGKATNGTLAIYMGVGEIENITAKLIDSGMSPEIPTAVIERGTHSTQRTLIFPLREIPNKVKEKNIKPPAVFIIGEVVNFREKLKWFEEKPLSGVAVMVTRPADQAQEMYQTLRQLGAEVLPYPTIATKAYYDESGWESFRKMKVEKRWLVFTSENGVRYFFRQMLGKIGDIRNAAAFKIAAVGFGTARALEKLSLSPDFTPSKATTADLAHEMKSRLDLSGADVVRIRGNLGDDTVERILMEAGASVLSLHVYETYHPAWPDNFRQKLFEYPPDVITFTSGSTADGLCAILTEDEIRKLTEGKVIASIGPSTSKVIESHGLHLTLEAREHNIPSLIKEITDYYKK